MLGSVLGVKQTGETQREATTKRMVRNAPRLHAILQGMQSVTPLMLSRVMRSTI
jgi:hypothetical protein